MKQQHIYWLAAAAAIALLHLMANALVASRHMPSLLTSMVGC
jgi:hypothetical protein